MNAKRGRSREGSEWVPGELFLEQKGRAHRSVGVSLVGSVRASLGNGRQSCHRVTD